MLYHRSDVSFAKRFLKVLKSVDALTNSGKLFKVWAPDKSLGLMSKSSGVNFWHCQNVLSS